MVAQGGHLVALLRQRLDELERDRALGAERLEVSFEPRLLGLEEPAVALELPPGCLGLLLPPPLGLAPLPGRLA